MVEHIKRTIGLVQWFEKGIVGSGWFVLLHDGSLSTLPGGQTSAPSFYTKLYRMKLDGKFVNTRIRFVYNHRDNWADFEISTQDVVGQPATPLELTSRKLMGSMASSTETTKEVTKAKA